MLNLSDVAGFINPHGRLPGMPSAEQVTEEGAALGETAVLTDGEGGRSDFESIRNVTSAPLGDRDVLDDRAPLGDRDALNDRDALDDRDALNERAPLDDRDALNERAPLDDRAA
jgi:hypothetical protein